MHANLVLLWIGHLQSLKGEQKSLSVLRRQEHSQGGGNLSKKSRR